MLQYTQIKEIFPMLLGQEISLNGKRDSSTGKASGFDTLIIKVLEL